MVPVICNKDLMGYGFNRIWRAVKKEALHLADSGAVNPEDVDRFWVLCFGSRLGPFAQMDEIGLDTILNVEKQYYEESRDEGDKPPKILTDLVDAGHFGKKSGKGFYDYPNPAYSQPGWLYKEQPWEEAGPQGTMDGRNAGSKKTG